MISLAAGQSFYSWSRGMGCASEIKLDIQRILQQICCSQWKSIGPLQLDGQSIISYKKIVAVYSSSRQVYLFNCITCGKLYQSLVWMMIARWSYSPRCWLCAKKHFVSCPGHQQASSHLLIPNRSRKGFPQMCARKCLPSTRQLVDSYPNEISWNLCLTPRKPLCVTKTPP